jgi:tellurite resistance protein TerC
VIFAVDSIPAIFAITHDPFLVFTSNVFAILGLRSLYFALAAVIDKFRYVKPSLVFVLAFVGLKMMLGHWIEVPTSVSLGVIGGILCIGLIASAFASRRARLQRQAPFDDLAQAAELAWKRARRVVILVVGLTIVFVVAPLTGLIPGPGGSLVAIAGLALLATEFVWARNLLVGLRRRALAIAARADVAMGKPRPWLIPIVVLAFGGTVAAAIRYEPQWATWIALVSIGPGIAIAYWAAVTIRRWRSGSALPPSESRPDSKSPPPASD